MVLVRQSVVSLRKRGDFDCKDKQIIACNCKFER